MGFFKSRKNAKIEELSLQVRNLTLDLEKALSDNRITKNAYTKQGKEISKLQEDLNSKTKSLVDLQNELKAKNNEISNLSKNNIDLKVNLDSYFNEIEAKENKIKNLNAKVIELSNISTQLNDLKIELLEKDAKISSLESELAKLTSNCNKIKDKKVVVESTTGDDIDDVDDTIEDDFDEEVEVCSVSVSKSEGVEDISDVEVEEPIIIPDDAVITYVDLNTVVTGLIVREVVLNGTTVSVGSWKDTYKEVVEYMSKNAPYFKIIVNKKIKIGKGLRTIVSSNKSDVTVTYASKDNKGCTVYEPLDIGGGLYLESPSLSSSDIVNRLKTLCDFVGLSQSCINLGVVRY